MTIQDDSCFLDPVPGLWILLLVEHDEGGRDRFPEQVENGQVDYPEIVVADAGHHGGIVPAMRVHEVDDPAGS